MLGLILLLGACGSDVMKIDDSDGVKPKEVAADSKKEEKPVKEESKEEVKVEDENVQESEIGKMTIFYKNKELDENAESGPMSLNVNAIQIGELEVAEDYKEMFDNKDKVTVITLKMKAENSSDDTINYYPDQATITTDAGDQSDAEIFLSDSIGGEFIGKVNKEGQVFFLVNSPASDIGEVNLIVDGPNNEDFDSVGEKVKMTFATK